MPHPARLFFDAISGRYDREYAPTSEESRARMARVLQELVPGSRVLDLGVGTGRELPALLDAGHAVTGLDVSQEMLDRCGRRARPVPLVLADMWERLPFGDGAFDAVIALHGTLAHPPSDGAIEGLASEVARVLAKNGVFVVEVPLPSWIDSAGAEVRRVGPREAVFTDPVNGATIEARLLDVGEWRRVVERHLLVTKAIERGHELFLAATRQPPLSS
jgi:SAM-dependent methyltransferase